MGNSNSKFKRQESRLKDEIKIYMDQRANKKLTPTLTKTKLSNLKRFANLRQESCGDNFKNEYKNCLNILTDIENSNISTTEKNEIKEIRNKLNKIYIDICKNKPQKSILQKVTDIIDEMGSIFTRHHQSHNNNPIKQKLKCVVCMEQQSQEEKLQSLKCKHKFHKDCIQELKKRNLTCPVCRGET